MTIFKFTAIVEIWADEYQEAVRIIDKIKEEGEFPDGSIVTDSFNIKEWRGLN